MEEEDLIVRYLERKGSRVIDIVYYYEYFSKTADGNIYIAGENEGVINKKSFFFGNVHFDMVLDIGGGIVLANRNQLQVDMCTNLTGRDEPGVISCIMAIGNGLSMLGNGSYEGVKRMYGIGFNYAVVAGSDVGAATWEIRTTLNGILYVMK